MQNMEKPIPRRQSAIGPFHGVERPQKLSPPCEGITGAARLEASDKQVGLDLRGAYLNLDGGFDSIANRTCIFNASRIPNIPENPRNRKRSKQGRLRLFNAAIHALRMRVERTLPGKTSASGGYALNASSNGTMA
jgi:hypothetical protein